MRMVVNFHRPLSLPMLKTAAMASGTGIVLETLGLANDENVLQVDLLGVGRWRYGACRRLGGARPGWWCHRCSEAAGKAINKLVSSRKKSPFDAFWHRASLGWR